MWFPEGAGPVPAILEYLPYRRRDRHRGDDSFTHPAMAASGYVCVRVDMRGSGDSDGLMRDEYTPEEWRDAVEVIAWIAGQPFCNGKVGMMGLSWGGFNALQVAALAPPELFAIVTTCASDDRYGDDMHYMGGCLLNDNLQYGSTLFTWLGTPPDPEIVGERWLKMWQDRLAAVEPPALRWMRHATRDDYWKSGSVCEDYQRIKVPVLAVGGWADGYTNAVMRLLVGLSAPRKGLIGPWAHAYPHMATPGPAIDFVAILVRWWDHWLKGRDTGVMGEPMLTCWLQESEEPRPSYTMRKGCWIAVDRWPLPAEVTLALHAQGAARALSPELAQVTMVAPARLASAPTTGTASGEWCPYGWGPDMPLDQRGDDAQSCIYDSAPLEQPIAFLGSVKVRLTLGTATSEGIVALRLEDVSPDGVSRRITYGLHNTALNDAMSGPRVGHPDGVYTTTVKLKDTGYEVPAGHRIRLALSTAYWPLAVGVPFQSEITVHGLSIALPLLPADTGKRPTAFAVAQVAPYPEAHVLVPPARGRLTTTDDLQRAETRVEVVRNLGAVKLDDGNSPGRRFRLSA